MTLLHDTPEKVPEFGQWVCSCDACRIAVHASKRARVQYVIKAERGREIISATVLAELMDRGDLDRWAENVGIGYVREVFVADLGDDLR